MALQDQNLVFSSAQAITATAVSTNTYDILTGAMITTSGGTYTVPANYIIGNATLFGADMGLGRGVGTPTVEVFSGTGTPITATSLQIALAGAPDTGSAGTIAALTFVPYIETEAVPIAQILASRRLACFDLPRREVETKMPRFYQIQYTVGGSNFGGLTTTAYINLGGTSAQVTLGQYAANY